jgi:hypothetical protein
MASLRQQPARCTPCSAKIRAIPKDFQMAEQQHAPAETQEPDVIEALVHQVPWVLPLVGGLLIFLLAFIAVTVG